MYLELEDRHVFVRPGSIPPEFQRGDVSIVGTRQRGGRGPNAEFTENVN
jgi:hypothetical protein